MTLSHSFSWRPAAFGLALAACAALLAACPPSKGLKYCATGASCPEGTVCAGNYCRPITCETQACSENEVCSLDDVCVPFECADARCKTGAVCVRGGECVTPKCPAGSSTCGGDLLCDPVSGACVEPSCYLVQCAGDEVCSGGNCIYTGCGPGGAPCPEGEACADDGTCQDARCIYHSCKPGKSCLEGACVDCAMAGGPGCACGDRTCAVGEACLADKCTPVSCPDGPACRTGEVCAKDGKSCVATDCASKSCPSGQICVGGACESATCGSTTCRQGQACATDTCVDALCAGKTCPTGQQCAGGRCLPTTCPGASAACPNGQLCEAGRCVDVRCVNAVCPAGKTCAQGTCVSISCEGGPACRPGEVCGKDGQSCVTTDCASVSCASGQICLKGKCESAACGSTTCKQGQACVANACVDVLCAGKTCPSGQQCAGGRCLPTTCSGASAPCPSGQLCDAGRCVDVRCVGALCPEGKACAQGTCVPTSCSGVACRAGEVCNKAGTACVTPDCYSAACGFDQICVAGQCVDAACGADTCVQGEVCKDGVTCVDAACAAVSCSPLEVCVAGSCHATWCGPNHEPCPSGTVCDGDRCTELRCVGVSCPSGQSCSAGTCVAGSGCAGGCPNGQVCLAGACRDSACADAPCKANEYCVEGTCVTGACAGVSCPSGQICVAGQCESATCGAATCLPGQACDPALAVCVDSICLQVSCPASELCVGGLCMPKDCPGGVLCPAGQACFQGQCTDTRCIGVYCPAGHYCAAGSCANTCQASEFDCGDGLDEDCDGLADCGDDDCAGERCDDGDACTSGDACTGGLCLGPTVKSCPASPPDDCHVGSGQCNPSTGKCDYAARATGAVCAPSTPPAECKDYRCSAAGACTATDVPRDTSCTGGVCSETGTCGPAGGATCTIAGSGTVNAGAPNPSNPCQYCAPSLSTTAWSPKAPGLACAGGACDAAGVCRPGCFISGTFYPSGAKDPSSSCRSCDPSKNPNDWTLKATGAACDDGGLCNALGQCRSACFIGGTLRTDGLPNPANPCQVCDPSQSTSSWTARADGSSCAPGKVCKAQACTDGCWVDGAFAAPRAVNPEDECEACLPAQDTQSYSRNDGATCSEGKCINGKCLGGCTISTINASTGQEIKTTYDDGAPNPKNECQYCDMFNPREWSKRPDGTPCSGGQTCNGGGCGPGCNVADKHYGPGEANPMNACMVCDPEVSTTKLTELPDLEVCGWGKLCYHSLCTAVCIIDGIPFPEKSTYPDDLDTPDVDESDTCLQCDPSRHFFSWSACKKRSVCWDEPPGGDDPEGRMCRLGCIERETPSAPLEYYEDGEPNPKETCQICDIYYSNWHWKPRDEAKDCDPYKVCNREGHCALGCGIGGHYYAPDEINYWNRCAICKPYSAVHSWSYLPSGTVCGDDDGVCYGSQCRDGCWIGGAYYDDGATHSSSGNGACEKCDTDKSRFGWQLNGGATCGSNQKCSTKSATCCPAGKSDC